MKKSIIFLLFTAMIFSSYGQTTNYTCTIPASITSSVNYVCSGNITMSGTRSISNNATVKIVAKQITINAGFSTTSGTNVIIDAMATPALRGDVDFYEEFTEDIGTSIDVPEIKPEIKNIWVYTVTGQSVYASGNNTDVYSIGLSPGVYIIQKEYENGEFKREKILIEKN